MRLRPLNYILQPLLSAQARFTLLLVSERPHKFWRAIVSGYLVIVHLALLFLLADRFGPKFISLTELPPGEAAYPTQKEPVPTPLPIPSLLSGLNPPQSNSAAIGNANLETQPVGGLLVPVAGVRRDQLVDTFTQARSEGRVHEAIDIMAAAGTPVVAAGDGTISKFWDSEKGGITIYELAADQKYFYYYAHLRQRADGIKEGDFLKRGTVIGYVGDTGNAGAGNYHLHFGITVATDPKRYWGGTNINPFPLLQSPAGEK